ncbi:hypothetical protein ACFXAF_00415 [Kitasatospora sp. NPDC059463]|uniref:hypothetical protein n=1 Tax=unclassified Kitasatospora TaxID=2633591 RepID=UPI0036839578
MDNIKTDAREILAIHREVDEWRNDYDPGSQEWCTLVNLAQLSARLVFSLPVDMLPEEELRIPSPFEYQAADELLAELAALEAPASRSFDVAFTEFQAEFPDVCLTYWERCELDDAVAEEGERPKLDASQWLTAKEALRDAVYEIVASHSLLMDSASHAIENGGDL